MGLLKRSVFLGKSHSLINSRLIIQCDPGYLMINTVIQYNLEVPKYLVPQSAVLCKSLVPQLISLYFVSMDTDLIVIFQSGLEQ